MMRMFARQAIPTDIIPSDFGTLVYDFRLNHPNQFWVHSFQLLVGQQFGSGIYANMKNMQARN